MNHPPPDICLADLLARTIPEGDCLLWQQRAIKGKFPQWDVQGKRYPVRRLLYLVIYGPIPPGLHVGVRCKQPLCVHPDCLVARTQSKAQSGRTMRPDHKAHLTLAQRANSKRCTMEIARTIRASDECGAVLEKRFNLRTGMASRIRLNQAWVDFANPFNGLGAKT